MDVKLTFQRNRVSDCGCVGDKKKCQELIWYTAMWLSDRVTSNLPGITLPCSLLAKCQCPTLAPIIHRLIPPGSAQRSHRASKVQTLQVGLKGERTEATHLSGQGERVIGFVFHLRIRRVFLARCPSGPVTHSSADPWPLETKNKQRLAAF